MNEDEQFWLGLREGLLDNDDPFPVLLRRLVDKNQEYSDLKEQLNICERDLILLNSLILLRCDVEDFN